MVSPGSPCSQNDGDPRAVVTPEQRCPLGSAAPLSPPGQDVLCGAGGISAADSAAAPPVSCPGGHTRGPQGQRGCGRQGASFPGHHRGSGGFLRVGRGTGRAEGPAVWRSPCPARPLPARARAGPGGLGAIGVPPQRKHRGQSVRVCRGRWGKEAGLNLRKRSPAARQLPGERVGAPSPALFGAGPRCRRCQAQGRRHPQMAPVSGTRLGLSFHGEAPTKGVTVLPGTGTAPNPSCTPQLSPACGQRQAPAGIGAGKVGHRPGVGCQNPPERDCGEPRNPSPSGRCPSPPGSKQAPFACSRNA